jgi:hypothetical protein
VTSGIGPVHPSREELLRDAYPSKEDYSEVRDLNRILTGCDGDSPEWWAMSEEVELDPTRPKDSELLHHAPSDKKDHGW